MRHQPTTGKYAALHYLSPEHAREIASELGLGAANGAAVAHMSQIVSELPTRDEQLRAAELFRDKYKARVYDY